MEGGDQERIVSMAVWHAPDRPAPWKVHSWRSVPKLSLTGTPARVACCVDRPRPPHAQVRRASYCFLFPILMLLC